MMYSPLTVPPDQVPRTGLVARVEDEVLHVTWCAPGGEIGQASMPRYVEGAYSTLSVPVSLTFRFEEGL